MSRVASVQQGFQSVPWYWENISNACKSSIATLFIFLPKNTLTAASFTLQKVSSPDGVGGLPEDVAKSDSVARGPGLRKA